MATSVELIKGDITKVVCDAIVNAANTTLLGGGGVDGAIHRAAGPGLLKECIGLKGCKTGEAKMTGGYDLPSRFVIHTPGPVWRGGKSRESELLASSYSNSLILAKNNSLRSIAFPSISTGVYRFPVDKAAMIAVDTTKRFIEANPGCLDKVIFVLFSEHDLEIYVKTLGSERCEL